LQPRRPPPFAGRVAGRHCCLPAPSEPYVLVSSHTAQAWVNAPSPSKGPRAPTRTGPYTATLQQAVTAGPDRRSDLDGTRSVRRSGPASTVRRGSHKPPALRRPAGLSEAAPARPLRSADNCFAPSSGWPAVPVGPHPGEVSPVSRGVAGLLSARLRGGLRFLPHPLPAALSGRLTAPLPAREGYGFTTFLVGTRAG
jgi:hypothetical protein